MRFSLLRRWFHGAASPPLDQSAQPIPAPADDPEAQFALGQQCAESAIPQDEQAAAWFRKAADQGHCQSQFALGLSYGQGKGVARSEAQSVVWLRKAAELGHAGAQYHLGVKLHRTGKSRRPTEARECRVEAYKWLELAVAQGYRSAGSAREFVTLSMTREEVEEGTLRAAAFPAVAEVAQPHSAS
jgi:TPR repeat protein